MSRQGCEQAAKDLGNVQVEFRISANNRLSAQNQIVRELMTQHVSGIAISPLNAALQVPVLNEASRQMIVVTQDSDAPDSNRTMYIGTDNRSAGRQMGAVIRHAVPRGSKIVILVGNIQAQNAKDRYEGIKDALAGAGIEIVDVLLDDSRPGQSKINAANALARSPQIAALIGLWNYNGPTILEAVREAHKVGQVKVICFDEDPEVLQGIKDGAVTATIVQQPYEFAYQAVKTMAAIARGNRSVIPAGKLVFVPTLVIDQDNIEQFLERIGRAHKQ